MHLTSKSVAPALRALVEKLIDYAGMFPPAKLSLDDTVCQFVNYKNSEQSWMLRWLVVSAGELPSVPRELDGHLAVLGTSDDARAASLETTSVVEAQHPVYCEVAPGDLTALDAVKSAGCFAKIRTGGVRPEAIPSPADVAAFITACAERRLPFKATAGLHHPVRAEYALTYEPDSPRAVMHGFINVLMAAAFAWNGRNEIVEILSETDPAAFKFDERAHWRNISLSADEVRKSRTEFLHSIGSCSFEEPVQELQKLGLM